MVWVSQSIQLRFEEVKSLVSVLYLRFSSYNATLYREICSRVATRLHHPLGAWINLGIAGEEWWTRDSTKATARPAHFARRARINKFDPVQLNPATVIPLPLVISLLSVTADKYGLDDRPNAEIWEPISHAPVHGLEVYDFAISSTASEYVLPMASYRFYEIKVIPNVVMSQNCPITELSR